MAPSSLQLRLCRFSRRLLGYPQSIQSFGFLDFVTPVAAYDLALLDHKELLHNLPSRHSDLSAVLSLQEEVVMSQEPDVIAEIPSSATQDTSG